MRWNNLKCRLSLLTICVVHGSTVSHVKCQSYFFYTAGINFTANGSILRSENRVLTKTNISPLSFFTKNQIFTLNFGYEKSNVLGFSSQLLLYHYKLALMDTFYLRSRGVNTYLTDYQNGIPGYFGMRRLYSAVRLGIDLGPGNNHFNKLGFGGLISFGMEENIRLGNGYFENDYSNGNETLLLKSRMVPNFTALWWQIKVYGSFSGYYWALVCSFDYSVNKSYTGNYSHYINGNLVGTDVTWEKYRSGQISLQFGLYSLRRGKSHSITRVGGNNSFGHLASEKPSRDTLDHKILIVKNDTLGLSKLGQVKQFAGDILSKDSTVEIHLWDYDKVDGDIIDVYLNGNLVLENYELKQDRKILLIKLDRGKNGLVIVFKIAGRMQPCTVGVKIIYEQKRSETFFLNSGRIHAVTIRIKCNRK